jgi:hypothetical protein
MPDEILYPNKTLRYQICNFIKNRRIAETGLGTSLRIPVREMGDLLQYANVDSLEGDMTTNRIELLQEELFYLDDELFGTSMDRRVINIVNKSEMINLVRAFENSLVLIVRCLSENIADYISELEARTLVARRYYGLVELKRTTSGGVIVVLGDKSMKVGRSKRNNNDLRINIVRLMCGGTNAFSNGDFSLENYERGFCINLVDLLDSLRGIEGVDVADASGITLDSIDDAVTGLNARSEEHFERPMFELIDGGIKWVL